MLGNIYLDLTNEFNDGQLRAILSSGQAVVLHRLALASKDGDWIVREDTESLDHILRVLESHGAFYRLGAPLDGRWMSGGWSAHFEFGQNGERIRCDFVSRPPRLGAADLAGLWQEQEQHSDFPVPTIDARRLAHLKATQRERDYPFIGELARRMPNVRDQIMWSRSARDLIQLDQRYPDLMAQMRAQRPLLGEISQGRRALERALDEERRDMAEADELRIAAYLRAARAWNEGWPSLSRQLKGVPLRQAHEIIAQQAEKLLPQASGLGDAL